MRGNDGVPKVFISSTQKDLQQHRDSARDAANSAECLPVMMEYFVASGQHAPLEACMAKVDGTDVTVVIVAHRYGWVPPGQDDDGWKSITWLECEQTRANGNEVLAFVVDPEHDWDAALREENRIAAAMVAGTDTQELYDEVKRNVAELKKFKSWIGGLGIRLTFTTPEDLRGKVSDALREWKKRNRKQTVKPTDAADGKTQASPTPVPTIPQAYRDWLQKQCCSLDLPIRRKEGHSFRLNSVLCAAGDHEVRHGTSTTG